MDVLSNGSFVFGVGTVLVTFVLYITVQYWILPFVPYSTVTLSTVPLHVLYVINSVKLAASYEQISEPGSTSSNEEGLQINLGEFLYRVCSLCGFQFRWRTRFTTKKNWIISSFCPICKTNMLLKQLSSKLLLTSNIVFR